ncbi:MAG: hypothetical protein LCH37_03210 [Bacteroidetes bacterium]|nr:hypothetical protein [Bacteroidota bacterium]
MRELNKYFFTKYGSVYYGQEDHWVNMENNYIVVVPPQNVQKYFSSNINSKDLEAIKKHAWVIRKDSLVNILNQNDVVFLEQNFEPWHSDETSKYLFIFGAGASAKGVKGDPKPELVHPPLGNELFHEKYEEIYNDYPGVKLSLHYLTEDNIDIESIFEEEWMEIESAANEDLIQRHISIQLYIARLLRNASQHFCSNYLGKTYFEPLMDHLARLRARTRPRGLSNDAKSNHQFTFISFNQDSILEYYISQYFKTTLKTLSDYTKGSGTDFNLFKPHGSHNWGWPFKSKEPLKNSLSRDLYDEGVNYYDLYFSLLGSPETMVNRLSYGQNLRFNKNDLGKFSINMDNLEIFYSGNSNSYFPALLIPYKDKDEFIMPSRAFYGMESKISEAEKVIIIGWKGREDAFNRILTEKGNNIKELIICDPTPEPVIENLNRFLEKHNNIKIKNYNGFEDFVKNGMKNEII